MKRKILTWLIVFSMLIGLMPNMAFATISVNELKSNMTIEETTRNGKEGILVKWIVNTGSQKIYAANTTFVYDSSVFDLVDELGNAVTLNNEDSVDSAQLSKEEKLDFDSLNKMYAEKRNNSDVALAIVRISATTAKQFANDTVLGSCFLAYKPGKSIEDVTRRAIREADADDIVGNLAAMFSVVYMMLADTNSTEIYYKAISGYSDTEGWEANITFGKDFNFAKLTPSYTPVMK